MQNTPNYNLKKPAQTDVVNIEDLNSNFDTLDTELKKVSDKANLIQTAGGTGTAITLNNVNLVNGFTITFVAAANNNGAATSINGKVLYKPGGTSAPVLTAGKAFTIWYNGTNFFIKASAEGNAAAGDVLAGKTFSSDADNGITGTMPNRGAVSQSLPINGTYAIPAGYHNGSGKVTQSITTKAAATITPGTSDQTIAAGQYLSGAQTVKGDSNLVTGNIKAGTSIFGISGKSSVVDTADATAGTGEMLSGKAAYVNGTKVTGNMTNRGAVTITPGTTNQAIPAGYHNGSGKVAGDTNLTAGNIKSGVSIFGVAGNLDAAVSHMESFLVTSTGYSAEFKGVSNTMVFPMIQITGLKSKPYKIIVVPINVPTTGFGTWSNRWLNDTTIYVPNLDVAGYATVYMMSIFQAFYDRESSDAPITSAWITSSDLSLPVLQLSSQYRVTVIYGAND